MRPGFCPAAAQFCEAVPIVATNSSHARDACQACYGVACVNGWQDGDAWTAYGVTAFYYGTGIYTAYCSTQGYVWKHKPADVADLSNNCGAGFW